MHLYVYKFSSVAQSCLTLCDPTDARLPCPSATPGAYTNSCPLSRWCHPTISSSVVPFSSCPQSFPASGSFQMSQLSSSGGQSIGVSASTSVLSMNTQDWSPLSGLVGSPCCPRDSQESSPTVQKHQFFSTQPSLWANSHIHTFPDCPVIKNPSCNAEYPDSIPGPGTKIPHATGQWSPCTTIKDPTHHN